jgi:hypothetical protein
MSVSYSQSQVPVHHYFRIIVAAMFGILALALVLASLLVVWANRTLTDTNTYVDAVAPLTSQPAIQEYVSTKVTEQLLQAAPVQVLAAGLIPSEPVAGKTNQQLTAEITPVIHDSVQHVISSPYFSALWRSTNQVDHAQFIQQLGSKSPTVTLDLTPFVIGVVDQFKTTKLSPIGDQIIVKPGSAELNLKGSQVDKLRTYYNTFKTSTLLIVVMTLFSICLCIVISVHHNKTLRRILLGTGILSLLVAGLIKLPSLLKPTGQNAITQRAIAAVVTTLLHNLQVACLAIGVICLLCALIIKIYSMQHGTA